MENVYSSPEFEIIKFKFNNTLSGEVVVSDPQIPTDAIDPGELE